jgi:hypothetical protein
MRTIFNHRLFALDVSEDQAIREVMPVRNVPTADVMPVGNCFCEAGKLLDRLKALAWKLAWRFGDWSEDSDGDSQIPIEMSEGERIADS